MSLQRNSDEERRQIMQAEEEWKQESARRSAALRQRKVQHAHAERSQMTLQRREEAQARKAEQDAEQHRQRSHAMQEKILLSERRRVQTARTAVQLPLARLDDDEGGNSPNRDDDKRRRAITKSIIPTATYQRLVGRNHAAMLVLSHRVHSDPVGFMKELINENGADSDAFKLARPPTKWR
jgi:hypothetical protein